MNEQDKRIVDFLISHGFFSPEGLQRQLEKRFSAAAVPELRVLIAREASCFIRRSMGERCTPSRWFLHGGERLSGEPPEAVFLPEYLN